MKLDHKDYINLLLFIAVIILMFIIVVKIQGDGAQCTFNPLQYGANQLRELNNEEVSCSCNLLSELPSGTLWFNHNGTSLVKPEKGVSFIESDPINYTIFNPK